MRIDVRKQAHLVRVVFVVTMRLLLGGLFLCSALPKIRQPYDFLSSVYGYELVGPKLGLLVAVALPWMELLVGICRLGGIFVNGALLASAGLAASTISATAISASTPSTSTPSTGRPTRTPPGSIGTSGSSRRSRFGDGAAGRTRRRRGRRGDG